MSGFTRGVSVYTTGKGIELLDLPAILQLQEGLD